jgi:hypothetical protein
MAELNTQLDSMDSASVQASSAPLSPTRHSVVASSSGEPRSPLSPRTQSTDPGIYSVATAAAALGKGNADMAVPALVSRPSNEENRHAPLVRQASSSSTEATPDPDTLRHVAAFIDTIHNHHDDSTASESHNTTTQRRSLHLVQSDDDESAVVVEPSVLANIKKYIDSLPPQATGGNESRTVDLTAILAASSSGEEPEAVPPEMLLLVRRLIENLPPKSPSSRHVPLDKHSSVDILQVDLETMVAMEACMEAVVEKSSPLQQDPAPVESAVPLVAETTLTESDELVPLVPGETKDVSDEVDDIHPVDSGASDLATRSRVCKRNVAPSSDEESVSMHTAVNASDAVDTGGEPDTAIRGSTSFKSVGSTSRVSFTLNAPSYRSYYQSESISSLKASSKHIQDGSAEGSDGKTTTTSDRWEEENDLTVNANSAVLSNVQGDSVLRSENKFVIQRVETLQTTVSEWATESQPDSAVEDGSTTSSAVEIPSQTKAKLVIMRADTEKTVETDHLSRMDEQSKHAADTTACSQDSGPAKQFSEDASLIEDSYVRSRGGANIADVIEATSGSGSLVENSVSASIAEVKTSTDEGLCRKIDTVEELADDGSFVDTSSPKGYSSTDAGNLETLEKTVDNLETFTVDEHNSVGSGSIPESLGNKLEALIDAMQERSEGKQVELPETLFRLKRDPPTEVPEQDYNAVEIKEDPPLTTTLSHELTRWLSGNENPETNPQKDGASTESIHPDPDCHTSIVLDFSGEMAERAAVALKETTKVDPEASVPSCRPTSVSNNLVETEQKIDDSSGDDVEMAATFAPLSQKRIPPRPEGTRRTNTVSEEKKDDTELMRRSRRELLHSFGSSQSEAEQLAIASATTKTDPLTSSKAFEQIYSSFRSSSTNACEKPAFVHLVRMVFADVKQGIVISESSIEDIAGLSPDVIKSFVDIVGRFQAESPALSVPPLTSERGSDTTREDNEIEAFLAKIFPIVESKGRDSQIPLDFIAGPTESEINGIEFEFETGYVRQEHAAAEEERTETPWWEATAQLVVASMAMIDGGDESDTEIEATSEDAGECTDTSKEGHGSSFTEGKEQNSVEDDIDEFWKSQHELRERRMHFRGNQKVQKIAEPPQFNEVSYSIQSATTGSGSFSKNTAPSFDTLEERWLVKRSMASHGFSWNRQSWLASKKETTIDVEEPESINGVEASRAVYDISMRWKEQRDAIFSSGWILPYETRTAKHSGFMGVDLYSLAASNNTTEEGPHRLDMVPWEKREVKQRFLHEQSIIQRNWFGRLKRYSSVTVVMPVCRPHSMEMPVKAPEWTEDWYRSPLLNPLGTNLSESMDGEANEYYKKYVQSDDFDEEDSWEDIPECGTLKNVRLKPGERISRVTPDLTSSLRRSRWRKKFFPKGSFPY